MITMIIILILILLILLIVQKSKFSTEIVDIVWSKGYPLYLGNTNLDYIFSSTEKNVEDNDILNQIGNKYVWVKMGSHNSNNNIKVFLDNIDSFNYPFVLVTSDGDSSIPLDIDNEILLLLLNNNNLIVWYTQNISSNEYNKIKPIPIGLDLHTIKTSPVEQLNEVSTINNSNNKILKIFCDVHLTQYEKFGNPRKEVSKLGYDTIYYLPNKIPRNELWEKYTTYSFVISTHGNGLDCHRTWEILLLGGIVITKSSSIDSLFENLPVVIVNDWSELNNISNLQLWYDKYHPLTIDIKNKLKINNFIKN